MKSISEVMGELDPEYRRKTNEINAKIQAQYDIAGAQMKLQRDIAEQQSRDRQRQEDERNRTSIDVENIRAKSARELLERGGEIGRMADSHKSHLDLLSKGAGGLLDSYAERRKMILGGVEENRKLRNGTGLAVVEAFAQNVLAANTAKREKENAEFLARLAGEIEMDRMEIAHRMDLARLEMENNAKFILKAYELEGVHGAKIEIDRLVKEWAKHS